jgi:hypothetical protein
VDVYRVVRRRGTHIFLTISSQMSVRILSYVIKIWNWGEITPGSARCNAMLEIPVFVLFGASRPGSFNPVKRNPQYPLFMRFGVAESWPGRHWKLKILDRTGVRSPTPRCNYPYNRNHTWQYFPTYTYLSSEYASRKSPIFLGCLRVLIAYIQLTSVTTLKINDGIHGSTFQGKKISLCPLTMLHLTIPWFHFVP